MRKVVLLFAGLCILPPIQAGTLLHKAEGRNLDAGFTDVGFIDFFRIRAVLPVGENLIP